MPDETGPKDPQSTQEEPGEAAPSPGDGVEEGGETAADPGGADPFSQIEMEIPVDGGPDAQDGGAEGDGDAEGAPQGSAREGLPEEEGIEVVLEGDEGSEGAAEEPEGGGAQEAQGPETGGGGGGGEAPKAGAEGESGDDSPEVVLDKAFDSALAEDELWDESGDLEDIPLFQELEKRDAQGGPEEAAAADSPGDAVPGTEEAEGQEESEEEFSRGRGEEDVITLTLPDRFFPYVAGAGGVLALLALFLLWHVASTPPAVKVIPPPAPQSAPAAQAPGPAGPSPRPVETLALTPFLIPGNRNGELVFFKVQAELMVESQAAKHALMRREAEVRDIIYSELKGIDLSNGVSGDVLLRYHKPILDRLNRAFRPIHVDDIRLVGVMLR